MPPGWLGSTCDFPPGLGYGCCFPFYSTFWNAVHAATLQSNLVGLGILYIPTQKLANLTVSAWWKAIYVYIYIYHVKYLYALPDRANQLILGKGIWIHIFEAGFRNSGMNLLVMAFSC